MIMKASTTGLACAQCAVNGMVVPAVALVEEYLYALSFQLSVIYLDPQCHPQHNGLHKSWAPEKHLLITISLEKFSSCFERSQIFFFNLPAPSRLVGCLLSAQISWLRKARGAFAKCMAPLSWGRGKVISDWEFNILKSRTIED